MRRHALRPRRARAGFTIVEVLIAMAIFMFGISAVLGLFQLGGGFEQSARVHAELAPAIEPLVEQLRDDAWRLDESGNVTGLNEFTGMPVPGAPDYRYDLEVEPGTGPDAPPRALLRFYRRTPDRVLATVAFLLPREVPVERRLSRTAR